MNAPARRPEIIVYASRWCPYCRAAFALLDRKGITYAVLDVDEDPKLWDEIDARTGRDTVPQTFIDGRHVGGYDDLSALDRAGGLDPLLFPKAPG